MSRSEPPPSEPIDTPQALAALAVDVFQPHYAEPLSLAEGGSMQRNVADVLSLLAEWRSERPVVAEAPAPAPDVAAPPEVVSEKAPRRRPRGRKFPAEIP